VAEISIDQVHIGQVPAKDSMLVLGYFLALHGDLQAGRSVIVAWLMSVYVERVGEMSTHRYVQEICRELGIAVPADRRDVPVGILQEASGRRFDRLHYPLLVSIQENGYRADMGGEITMVPNGGQYRVSDGHNRTSILAAMGKKMVPNVRFI
jgi:hypothetical protein